MHLDGKNGHCSHLLKLSEVSLSSLLYLLMERFALKASKHLVRVGE